MEKDNTVKQAGGFIIQLMPFAEEEVIEKLEKNLAQVSSVTKLLDEGKTQSRFWKYFLGIWTWRFRIRFQHSIIAIAARNVWRRQSSASDVRKSMI